MKGYREREGGEREWVTGGNCLNAITGTRVVTRNVRNVFFLLVCFCYSLAFPPSFPLYRPTKYEERTRVRRVHVARCNKFYS